MTLFIRIALFVLLLDELVVGFWNQTFPASFYTYFPTVDLTPPFSEHYARDFGGATLGIVLLLGIAAIKPRTVFVIPAALAFSLFAIPHLFYHLHHLEGTTVGEAIALTSSNVLVALLGIVIILVTSIRDRRARHKEAVPSGATTP